MLSIAYILLVFLIILTSCKVGKDKRLLFEILCSVVSLVFFFLDNLQNSTLEIYKFSFLVSNKSFFILPILACLSINYKKSTDLIAIFALSILAISNSAFTIIFTTNLYLISYVMFKGFNKKIGIGLILSSLYSISSSLSFLNNSLGFFSLILFALLFLVYEIKQDKIMYFVILYYFKVLQFNEVGNINFLKILIAGFCIHTFLEYYLKIRERGFLGITFLGFLLLTRPLLIPYEIFYLVIFVINSKESSFLNIMKIVTLSVLMFVTGSESLIFQTTLFVFLVMSGIDLKRLKVKYKLKDDDIFYMSSFIMLLFGLKTNYQSFNVYGLITFFLYISVLALKYFKDTEIDLINHFILKNIQPMTHILDRKYKLNLPIFKSTFIKERHILDSVRILTRNTNLEDSIMALVVVGVISFLLLLFLLL
jgi:hypothetical protein